MNSDELAVLGQPVLVYLRRFEEIIRSDEGIPWAMEFAVRLGMKLEKHDAEKQRRLDRSFGR